MRATFKPLLRKLHRRLSASDGFGLMELIIAMFLLTVAISAMLLLYVSTEKSMRRAGQNGTALTLAEKQMEVYRTVPFRMICLLTSPAIPTGSDPYVSTNPSSIDQATAGDTAGDAGCPSPAASSTVGPDHRNYRVDTYVEYVSTDTFSHLTPAIGLGLKRVTVIVRDGDSTSTILARASSTFVTSS